MIRLHDNRFVASVLAGFMLLGTSVAFAQDGGSIVEKTIDPYSFQPENVAIRVDAETVDIAGIFEDLDPVAGEWYQHVMTLSNPWFEGRAPGSDGIERAADYLEFWFERNGLDPAFPAKGSSDEEWTSYRQSMILPGGRPQITKAEMSVDGRDLEAGRDFVVLGNAGTDSTSGPLAFAGYAIEDGPDGFSSFDSGDGELPFAGHVVMVFRYEPLDSDGRSRFTSRRFSTHASIHEKMSAIADRGAAGIVLVNPPGALFGSDRLEDGPSSRYGDSLSIPVVQVTPRVAEMMLASAGAEQTKLSEWRKIADEGGHGAIVAGMNGSTRISTGVDGGARSTENIGGVLRGKGELADEWVVIGGHYDHVGFGDIGAMPINRGRLHPGADDDASGTSAVIILSRLLAERYAEADDDESLRSILFMGFTAEESGLNGSRYYVEHPTLPAGSINAMLNLDMIGRLRDDTLAVGGTGSAAGMLQRIRPDLEASRLDIVADPNGRGPSDHASFYGAGIPVLFFFTGTHDVYHQPGDFGWTVNPRGAAKVIDLVEDIGFRFASDPERLRFGDERSRRAQGRRSRIVEPDPNDRGYAPVRLGISPGMGGGDTFGVRVEEVSEGTSAAEGGIQKDDIIVAWGGEDLVDVMDMLTRLRELKPGDVVQMVVLRDGEEIELDITMKASDRKIAN